MVEVDVKAILDEIDSLRDVETMQLGDITVDMLMEHWNKSNVTCRRRMRELEKRGLFTKHHVLDTEVGCIRAVWRKVQEC